MTAQEFKAWFAGYSEGIGRVPSEAQWNRICEQVTQMTILNVTAPASVGSNIHQLLQGYPQNFGGSNGGIQ